MVTINIIWMEEREFPFSLIDVPIQNSVDKFPNPRLYSFQILLNFTWPENRRWKTYKEKNAGNGNKQ